MAWITLYITGKPNFEDAVLDNLEKSEISFLPGSNGDNNNFLIWVDETLPLRQLKEAIGSKTVFKYRLQFFTSLSKHQGEVIKAPLTPREQAMILEMKAWEGRKYRHSA
jgi:hypothetical protein